MADVLPHASFAKTDGFVVPAEKLYDASYGQVCGFEKVDIEIAHGSCCTFLVIKSEGKAQYIALDDDRSSVLGHALTTAVRR